MTNTAQGDNAEAPSCRVCGTAAPAVYRRTVRGFRLYGCSDCGAVFVHPQPSTDELLAIYTADYFSRGGKYMPTSVAAEANRQNDLSKIRLVSRYVSSGRVLDVGCGMGGFLEVAREAGYAVAGVEVSEAAAKHVRATINIEVAHSDLPAAGFPPESFDVISLWDVLEHLPAPDATLQQAYRLLRPGGYLFATTGDIASFWARLMGRYWQLLTPPQHLFFFTPVSLQRMINRHGFHTTEILHTGKRATVEFILFKARETFGPLVAPLQALARFVGAGRWSVYVNLRDIMTCVARRPPSRR